MTSGGVALSGIAGGTLTATITNPSTSASVTTLSAQNSLFVGKVPSGATVAVSGASAGGVPCNPAGNSDGTYTWVAALPVPDTYTVSVTISGSSWSLPVYVSSLPETPVVALAPKLPAYVVSLPDPPPGVNWSYTLQQPAKLIGVAGLFSNPGSSNATRYPSVWLGGAVSLVDSGPNGANLVSATNFSSVNTISVPSPAGPAFGQALKFEYFGQVNGPAGTSITQGVITPPWTLDLIYTPSNYDVTASGRILATRSGEWTLSGGEYIGFSWYDSTSTLRSIGYSPALVAGTTYQIEVSFDASGNFRLFVNGTLVASQATSLNNPSSSKAMQLGASSSTTGPTGIIDELRISNIARHTASFAPYTQPFTSDANTACLYHFDSGSPSLGIVPLTTAGVVYGEGGTQLLGGVGLAFASGGGLSSAPLPDLVLPAGTVIQGFVWNLQSSDQWNGVTLILDFVP